ncbi:hypothetical protein ATCVCanal1_338L [Acanthocystis turfacea Chlorella virus Canal-1]|nr:hypothetical protein ATCVCanal1_338L [Acanthocystis turfacea Chlorella virus Canal-1]
MCSVDRMYDVLTRLYKSSTSLVLRNKNSDFQIIIRPDAEASQGHYMSFDVVIYMDIANAALLKCLQNYADAAGFNNTDDNEEFLVASFEIDKRSRNDDDVVEFCALINDVENISICQCGERFIHDDGEMCTFCDLFATKEGLEQFDCSICMDACRTMHSTTFGCCGNMVHKLCDAEWYKKGNKTCPFCRSPLPERQTPQVTTIDDIVASIATAVEQRLSGNTMPTTGPV